VADQAESAVTRDRLLGGKLILAQPREGHRAGTDAVLLAACVPEGAGRIADLGAATGVVGLAAALMNPGARVTLFEREQLLIGLARENIAANDLTERLEALEADVLRLGGDARFRETFDCVLTNPPFFEEGAVRRSPQRGKSEAHVFAVGEGLEAWLRAATAILAPKGQLVMIHRADRIAEVLQTLAGRMGEARLRFVYAEADQPAIRLLVSARKGSRAPLQILPPLVLQVGGAFTAEVEALHRGEARIGF
jgi:tRNA1(Val) A37 N6-methylase TrmN6